MIIPCKGGVPQIIPRSGSGHVIHVGILVLSSWDIFALVGEVMSWNHMHRHVD